MFGPLVTDHAWAAERVASLPNRWQARILGEWGRARERRTSNHWTAEQEAHRAANVGLLAVTESLEGHRLPLDASDAEIVARAEQLAALCFERAQLFHQVEPLHDAMARVCIAQGVQPPTPKDENDLMPSIRRMTCPLWWRRQLRRVHAKAVEGAAIVLGLVNRRRDPYVSRESLERRTQQNRRNAEALEATIARNELGQEFTLAELAAKGPANKAIRRAELMTRISGFERIARAAGHAGLFFTITCPSRMHKWRTVKGGAVIENPRYDGTNPREAQSYLAKVWARIRAALKRRDLGLYGFRIAEPNHDGTPHWHLLVFHDAARYADLTAIIWRYALADSPNEPGAHRHRVDLKPIDWERGTAAGYIAKYVAKNIDGHRIEKDLLGNDALETAARVEAWAATWGIRQFQQVGGPPVTVWRELRRVESVPDSAPEHMKQAHRAVNRVAVLEGRENASVAWDHYVEAQGGVFCGRKYRIRISTIEREGVNRYGEPLAPATWGVETIGIEYVTPYWMAHMPGAKGCMSRVVDWVFESSRHRWEIVARNGAGRLVSEGPQAPWTRVNNCTEGGEHAQGTGPRGGRESRAGGMEWRTAACADAGGRLRSADARGARADKRGHGSH